ncbi:MAG TPA: Asp-tRNA(Asn)/Glu-tRNA(Gln) amidotransferase subunit GatB [Bacilli bacterium]|nr:Asp-tRNA(Asn)/Glu-tRNA(Gln) amidotransferase subunit GatB [Bacilli bacterium]
MYKVVIGLETHCELNTKKKVFSNSNNIYSQSPNTNISAIDLGFPGILPVLNKESVVKALQVAIALNSKIPAKLTFDRKNYYYPDLPKGYQITQSKYPIGEEGYALIDIDGETRKVLIHDIHLEEDSASLDHVGDSTLVDYNRAGVPLIEIVTEPCLNSSSEAVAYLESLRNMLLYLDVSEARADRGQIRCDVNVSLMKDTDTKLGTKVEMKNINSFANVKDAIDAEVNRQREALDKGEAIIQETRRYDEITKTTHRMRDKVESIDYKYFTEPNIPDISLKIDFISSVKTNLPILPYDRKKKYLELGISLVDANTLVRQKDISDYFNQILGEGIEAKTACNWIISVVISYLNKTFTDIKNLSLTPKMLSEVIKLVESSKISGKQGKELLTKSLEDNIDPIEIFNKSNMTQITDIGEITNIITKIIDANLNLVEDYRKGKNVFNFFIGQVMKETKGTVNPKIASDILKQELDKR